jgi:2,3-dihydroxyphenylpropionate 1,2-dioxygenase
LITGPVNEEADREFLRLVAEKDFAALRSWTAEYIGENLGNGGQEIHNWLVLLGALQNYDAEVAFYEPIPEWVTGMAIVQFSQPVSSGNGNKKTEYEVKI